MKQETIMQLSRAELLSIIEDYYKVKFWKTSLSHDGLKGWVQK
jgi:hypothetical protein